MLLPWTRTLQKSSRIYQSTSVTSSLTISPLLSLCWASDLAAKMRWVLSLLRLYFSATRKLTSDINCRKRQEHSENFNLYWSPLWKRQHYPTERKNHLDPAMALVVCLWINGENLHSLCAFSTSTMAFLGQLNACPNDVLRPKTLRKLCEILILHFPIDEVSKS